MDAVIGDAAVVSSAGKAVSSDEDDPVGSWGDEENRVGLADLSAAAGCRSGRPEKSTGVIYWSSEEFLAHLDAQPYELPGS